MNILFCTFNKIVLEDGCCSLFYMFFRHHVTQLCIKGHKLSKQLIGKAPFPILITIRIHVVYNLLIKFAVPAYFVQFFPAILRQFPVFLSVSCMPHMFRHLSRRC